MGVQGAEGGVRIGGKVVAILSPSEGLLLTLAFTASSSSPPGNVSGQAFPLRPCWDGAVGVDGDAGCISDWGAIPGLGGTAFLPSTGWSPHPGARAGVSLPPLPTVGLKPPPSRPPPNLGVLHPPVPRSVPR